jgi:N-methylhydantoinase A
MMRAVKAVSTFRGRDPREFPLFAFGGNGPIMAVEVARQLKMQSVVIPPSPGVFSALGLLYSKTQHELIQTFFRPLDSVSDTALEAQFTKLETQCRDDLIKDGYEYSDITLERYADLRYAGQAFELSIQVASGEAIGPDIKQLLADFHAEHERTYGHMCLTDPVEFVNVRVVGRSKSHEGRSYAVPNVKARGSNASSVESTKCRDAYFGREYGTVSTSVITRADLLDTTLNGPLIIEEYDSTCVVAPGCQVSLDNFGNVNILLEED